MGRRTQVVKPRGVREAGGPRFMTWLPAPNQAVEAMETPGNVEEANLYLQQWLVENGHEDTQFYKSDTRCVARVCALHGKYTTGDDGERVYEACGMMWRCALSGGWVVEERQADACFDGLHGRGTEAFEMQRAAVKDNATRKKVLDMLHQGKQPRAIHTSLLKDRVSDSSSETVADGYGLLCGVNNAQ